MISLYFWSTAIIVIYWGYLLGCFYCFDNLAFLKNSIAIVLVNSLPFVQLYLFLWLIASCVRIKDSKPLIRYFQLPHKNLILMSCFAKSAAFILKNRHSFDRRECTKDAVSIAKRIYFGGNLPPDGEEEKAIIGQKTPENTSDITS